LFGDGRGREACTTIRRYVAASLSTRAGVRRANLYRQCRWPLALGTASVKPEETPATRVGRFVMESSMTIRSQRNFESARVDGPIVSVARLDVE